MSTWQDSKTRGSAAFSSKRFNDAILEFSAAIVSIPLLPSELAELVRRKHLHVLLDDRSAAYQQLKQFDKAAADADACTRAADLEPSKASKHMYAKGASRCSEMLEKLKKKALPTQQQRQPRQLHYPLNSSTHNRSAINNKTDNDSTSDISEVNSNTANNRTINTSNRSRKFNNLPKALPLESVSILLSRLLLSGLVLFNGVIFFFASTNSWKYLILKRRICLTAYAVHALVRVFSGHGRPHLNMKYGMRVLVDPTATQLLGAWALVVGHSSLLLLALLLPEAAIFAFCAAHLTKRAKQPLLASIITKPCSMVGLLDATGSLYWKVNQISAYLEVSALFALSISLVIPSMRNFLMLIVYGQSVHVGRHFL